MNAQAGTPVPLAHLIRQGQPARRTLRGRLARATIRSPRLRRWWDAAKPYIIVGGASAFIFGAVVMRMM